MIFPIAMYWISDVVLVICQKSLNRQENISELTCPVYILAAKKNFSEFGDFYCCSVNELDTIELPPIDIVILKGVLHHLSDETVKNMMACLSKVMKPNARFISLDPTFTERQNPIAKFFVSKDRGVNVRTFNNYKNLLQSDSFSVDRSEVIHQYLPPYDRTLLQVRRN